jgi:hypothetical protein
MAVSLKISPVNSLIFLHDRSGWTPPFPIRGQLIWSTPSCIATACYPEIDGPTEIVLGLGRDVALDMSVAFDGMLETPRGEVVVTTASDDQPVLRFDVPTPLTRVRIWHSDPRWPEKVTIALN